MSINEFLRLLRKTPRKWVLDGEEIVRCGDRCPLEVVAGMRSGLHCTAAAKLGIGDNLRVAIVIAADHPDGRLRAQLLRACGLRAPKPKRRKP